MQAITTKYFGPTNTKGSRIKASCNAGTKTYDYYDLVGSITGYGSGSDAAHIEAAKRLKLHLANDKNTAHWNRETVCGWIAQGDIYAHVFTK